MRKYREYTDLDVVNAVKESTSMAQVLKKLDLRATGGNYDHLKFTIQRLNLNTDHFTGKAWNKGIRQKDWSSFSRVSAFKKHLISERSHVCENCGNSLWMGKAIALEVHHIDGDRTNNSFNNLKLLCPNCHSQTESWRKPK